MKILLIDNFDSFTFNLVHYIEGLNCSVNVIRPDSLNAGHINDCERIIISPGPGLPKDYKNVRQLIKNNLGIKPILGVCLGFQLIGELLGGELYNLNEVRHGVAKKIKVLNHNSIFHNIENEFYVGLYHSWGLRKTERSAFDVIAISMDETIMAIENIGMKTIGVQFHPESILTENGQLILSNFLKI
jgi:anthranilate synthase component 2